MKRTDRKEGRGLTPLPYPIYKDLSEEAQKELEDFC